MKPAHIHVRNHFCSGATLRLIGRVYFVISFSISKNQSVLDSTLSRADLYLQKAHGIQGEKVTRQVWHSSLAMHPNMSESTRKRNIDVCYEYELPYVYIYIYIYVLMCIYQR